MKEKLNELVALAKKYTDENVLNNKTVTAITVSAGTIGGVAEVKAEYGVKEGGNTYFEPAFTGCGALGFQMSPKDWKLAKSLGGEKGHKTWTLHYEYYNGQYGDACRGYSKALAEMKVRYPGSFLDKITTYQWID